MKIIGHRGARGLAPENTIVGFKRGLSEGVDGIEFDIHATKDGELVVLHDESFARTCGVNRAVADLTLEQIRKIRTHEGEPIPTLAEALAVIDSPLIVVEGKGKNWAELLAKALKNHPKSKRCVVISFDHEELAAFGRLSPNHKLYGLEDRHPFAAIRSAKRNGFYGIDLNYGLLIPPVYVWAKLNNLDIFVYTVNRTINARLIRHFCPGTAITTDYPNLMQGFRR